MKRVLAPSISAVLPAPFSDDGEINFTELGRRLVAIIPRSGSVFKTPDTVKAFWSLMKENGVFLENAGAIRHLFDVHQTRLAPEQACAHQRRVETAWDKAETFRSGEPSPKLMGRKAMTVPGFRSNRPECLEKLVAAVDPKTTAIYPAPVAHRHLIYQLRKLATLFLAEREETEGAFFKAFIAMFNIRYPFGDEARIAGRNALTAAIQFDQPLETIKQVCSAGGRALIEAADGQKETALTLAVRLGSMELVPVLLDAGANVASKDGNGETALMVAVRLGSMELVRGLLDAGANVNTRSARGRTPLLTAIDCGHGDIADILLSKGVDSSELTAEETFSAIAANRTGREAIARSVLIRIYDFCNQERKSDLEPTHIHDLVSTLWNLAPRFHFMRFLKLATDAADECGLNKTDREDLILRLTPDKAGRYRDFRSSLRVFERFNSAVDRTAKEEAAAKIRNSIQGIISMTSDQGADSEAVLEDLRDVANTFLSDICRKIADEGLVEGDFEALMSIISHPQLISSSALSTLFDVIANRPMYDIYKISFNESGSYLESIEAARLSSSFFTLVLDRLNKAASKSAKEKVLRLFGRMVRENSPFYSDVFLVGSRALKDKTLMDEILNERRLKKRYTSPGRQEIRLDERPPYIHDFDPLDYDSTEEP